MNIRNNYIKWLLPVGSVLAAAIIVSGRMVRGRRTEGGPQPRR